MNNSSIRKGQAMSYRISVLLVFIAASAFAQAQEDSQAPDEKENRAVFTLAARARAEKVEIDNLLLDATSVTARIRAGLITPTRNGFDAIAELEAVGHIGSDDFNSGANGRTQFAAVLDPQDVEINQLAVRYRHGHHYLQLGRQRMPLDNQRYFGDVGYRQNQQTYDALSYMNTALQGQQFRYVYMARARRFLSDENPVGEIDMNSHLLNYRWQRLNGDALTAYAYLIDMDTAPVAQRSTKTLGLRYTGSVTAGIGDFLYAIEYADQSDFADGDSGNDADYLSAEIGLKFNNEWVVKLGQERLGGDGNYGFQTPFGTNHKFNGFADVFAGGTPASGLIDSYASLTVPIAGARLHFAAHDFAADAGNADYANEFNFQIEKRFAQRFSVNLLFADYRADDFGSDTTKWAVWFDFNY